MKIDTDLRLAIRSVTAAQKETDSWIERRKKEKSAIDALIAKTGVAAKVRAANRDLEKASELNKRAGKVFASLGLSNGANSILDETKFIKAGGRFATNPKPQRFELVMARLAAANESEGSKIIKRLGINWT